MKTEMITLSSTGALALFVAGACVPSALCSGNWTMLLLAATLINYARVDAREPWLPGVWQKGKLLWTRTGPCQ